MTIYVLQRPKTFESRMKKFVNAVDAAKAVLASAQDAILDYERTATKLYCAQCAKHRPVKEWTFLRDYWYVAPYGCTGGDYWKENDIHFVRCPCGFTVRLWAHEGHPFHALNKREELFASVEKVYDHKGPTRQYRESDLCEPIIRRASTDGPISASRRT